MTYTSIEQIETKFAKPAEDENQIDRNKRLKAKRQAIRRFNDSQRSTQARFKTTMSSTSRKQKSRSEQTTEQKQNAKKQKRIKYAAKQEQLKKQFLKLGCCNIDDYMEGIVEGNEIENSRHRFERMSNSCEYCYALKWKDETEGFCCQSGKVVLSPLSPAPPNLYNLLTSNDPVLKEPFVNQIRLYNNVLAFTSLRTKVIDDLATAKKGVYTLKIQGVLYQQISDLMPDNKKPKFAQIYFYDTDLNNQLQRRCKIFPQLNSNMLKMLQDELHNINPFVKSFTNAGNYFRNESISDMELIIHNTHGKDMIQYNQPTASEVAVILDLDHVPGERDIVLKTHEGRL